MEIQSKQLSIKSGRFTVGVYAIGLYIVISCRSITWHVRYLILRNWEKEYNCNICEIKFFKNYCNMASEVEVSLEGSSCAEVLQTGKIRTTVPMWGKGIWSLYVVLRATRFWGYSTYCQ